MIPIRILHKQVVYCLLVEGSTLSVDKLLDLLMMTRIEINGKFELYYNDKEQDKVNVAVDEDLKEMLASAHNPQLVLEESETGTFSTSFDPSLNFVQQAAKIVGECERRGLGYQTLQGIRSLQQMIIQQDQQLSETKKSLADLQEKHEALIRPRIQRREKLQFSDIDPSKPRHALMKQIHSYCSDQTEPVSVKELLRSKLTELTTFSTCTFSAETESEMAHAQECYQSSVDEMKDLLSTHLCSIIEARRKRLELRNEVKLKISQMQSPLKKEQQLSQEKPVNVTRPRPKSGRRKKTVGFSEVVVKITPENSRVQNLVSITGMSEHVISSVLMHLADLNDDEIVGILLESNLSELEA